MRLITPLFLLLLALALEATSPGCRKNEESVFGFRTNSNKIVSLCTGRTDSVEYLVYRYGTDSTTELEYPGILAGSFAKFFYSFYLRGGGKENEGIDINNLGFRNGDYLYELYQEYAAADSSTRIGIRVKNERTGKKTCIKGKPETVVGSLIDLRFDDRVPK